MDGSVAGFDWDAGNITKCENHGVSCAAIEAVFHAGPGVAPDVAHSVAEQRFVATAPIPEGMTGAGRGIFVVFTMRQRNGMRLIRPISARYMHKKEQRRYDQFKETQSASPDDG